MAQFAPVDKPNIVQKFSGHQPFMYLYLVYVLCCLVLNTLKTFEIADLYGIITAKQLLYRAMPNGSPLTRQPPSDGQLYHAASRTWYNNRSTVIIPILWPRRFAGAARCRPNGRLYHAASRTWYNNRSTVIIPILWSGRYPGGPFPLWALSRVSSMPLCFN